MKINECSWEEFASSNWNEIIFVRKAIFVCTKSDHSKNIWKVWRLFDSVIAAKQNQEDVTEDQRPSFKSKLNKMIRQRKILNKNGILNFALLCN